MPMIGLEPYKTHAQGIKRPYTLDEPLLPLALRLAEVKEIRPFQPTLGTTSSDGQTAGDGTEGGEDFDRLQDD